MKPKMLPEFVVVDFDGTATDVEEEGKDFGEAFYTDVAVFLGVDPLEFIARAVELEPKLDPAVDCWEFGGFKVAPATLDPYLRSARVSRLLARQLRPHISEAQLDTAFREFFLKNYPDESVACFKPGAKRLTRWMVNQGNAIIVTNSGTGPVCAKLKKVAHGRRLTTKRKMCVYGDAKKYIITDDTDFLIEHIEIPGLVGRKVLLRRGHYYRLIASQMVQRKVSGFGKVLVIGDVMELDLALPMYLGAHGILMTSERTPDYEVAYMNNHPHGHTAGSIDELMAILEHHYSA